LIPNASVGTASNIARRVSGVTPSAELLGPGQPSTAIRTPRSSPAAATAGNACFQLSKEVRRPWPESGGTKTQNALSAPASAMAWTAATPSS
jgi:hypothetical protein